MADIDIDDLFAQTLQGDYDGDKPWYAVRLLHTIGTREVFDKAVKWTESDDPLLRARGLDVIAQIGKSARQPSNRFPLESFDVVFKIAQCERQVQPLASAISALGHINDTRGVPLIAGFHSHLSEVIRFAVAFALGCSPNHPLSTQTLLTLMEDADDDVRDWATFAVGVQGDRDSSEIREALSRRLNDDDTGAREEAILGLANRHDPRVVPHLIDELEESSIGCRVVEAACTLLGLETDREQWSGEDYVRALRERFPGMPLKRSGPAAPLQ